jgi:hypothetical protein
MATALTAQLPAPGSPLVAWLEEPALTDWQGLARFDRTLTRHEFEVRLDGVFDPSHALRPYLRIANDAVAIYASSARDKEPLVVVHFAPNPAARIHSPVTFRSPTEFLGSRIHAADRPLAGMRIVIEPADIGGRWAEMEDRSVDFPGYGRINEGDHNLAVALLLRARLAGLGAEVFLVRDRAEPVLSAQAPALLAEISQALRQKPAALPDAFFERAKGFRLEDPRQFAAAAGLLLTKTLETHARAMVVRRSFQPDLTIVLQHNATAESTHGGLTKTNRNIFFVNGAYSEDELRQPAQRLRMLTKLLENVTPIEAAVAALISRRFEARTGFPPVGYGNSATTRRVVEGNDYVVARNLAFNRTHDGPVVVTEPYFMNQPDTLVRLLAGDFPGERIIAGRLRTSIYREYVECVTEGILDAYVRLPVPVRRERPQRPSSPQASRREEENGMGSPCHPGLSEYPGDVLPLPASSCPLERAAGASRCARTG